MEAERKLSSRKDGVRKKITQQDRWKQKERYPIEKMEAESKVPNRKDGGRKEVTQQERWKQKERYPAGKIQTERISRLDESRMKGNRSVRHDDEEKQQKGKQNQMMADRKVGYMKTSRGTLQLLSFATSNKATTHHALRPTSDNERAIFKAIGFTTSCLTGTQF